ncbi:hypothetical protein ACFVYV_43345 [Streptomyces mirabilis]|uniref:hypothetical protein n=1 Tax=Streptomyces mirabilis TaxID=68239 RepID=UPI0036D93FAE
MALEARLRLVLVASVANRDGERKYWLHEIGHKPWSLERCGLPDGTAAIRRWGKKRAGRELDGRTWDEFPKVVRNA